MSDERLAPPQHDSLEGIPEPSENPVLFGHRQAGDTLAAAYRIGKLPHALLFVGPQGIGKATLAFHLANHLIRHPDAGRAPERLTAPDPASSLFRQIASAAHPSVLHLTRPLNDKTKSFKTVLTVDEVRRVNRFLSLTSHDGGYRVVVIDPADDMNTNAANALLKNLEEPPARTLFILIAHSLGSLLPTIRSRCQVVRLSALDDEALAAVLETVGVAPPAPGRERAALALRSGGSARMAILLTRYGGLEIADALESLVGGGKLAVGAAHRLADAVAGRDQSIPFAIFNEHGLDMLTRAASAAAEGGNAERAAVLSRAWQEMRVAIRDTDTYNLDRKQHALNMISRLHDSFRM